MMLNDMATDDIPDRCGHGPWSGLSSPLDAAFLPARRYVPARSALRSCPLD
jgi:hypothetical protein